MFVTSRHNPLAVYDTDHDYSIHVLYSIHAVVLTIKFL